VGFPLNVYVAAVVSACITTLAALPFWRKWCLRHGVVDDPGHRKIHKEPTPLAGGLAVMTGLLLPIVVAAAVLWAQQGAISPPPKAAKPDSETAQPNRALDAYSTFLLRYGLSHRALELAGILTGALGMLVVGLLDDKYELKPAAKFSCQLAIAALVAASGARITLFVPSLVFSYAITILWILTVINAFNFMDNMNGLCAGLAGVGAAYFAIVAAMDGQYLVALIAFLTFGALLGFLPYNFPKAPAFLGDSGSHLVGFVLAVLAILPHFYNPKHPRRWAVFIPLAVLAVPLFDMAWVVMLRWRAGKPFYVGDTNHISHRLVRRGFTQKAAVLAIWGLAAAIGALALLA
jgi:UDP-GlcNAc:undecaprenyl-phosphate GlcNAc-1-phosphate transferase